MCPAVGNHVFSPPLIPLCCIDYTSYAAKLFMKSILCKVVTCTSFTKTSWPHPDTPHLFFMLVSSRLRSNSNYTLCFSDFLPSLLAHLFLQFACTSQISVIQLNNPLWLLEHSLILCTTQKLTTHIKTLIAKQLCFQWDNCTSLIW